MITMAEHAWFSFKKKDFSSLARSEYCATLVVGHTIVLLCNTLEKYSNIQFHLNGIKDNTIVMLLKI